MCDPITQVIPFRFFKAGTQSRIALVLMSLGSPLTAIVNTRDPRHAKTQGIDQRQVFLVCQIAGDPGHVMVIHKRQHMLAPVQSPVLRTELPQQRMIDLEHVHTVETGKESLIAFIVSRRMQHLVIDHLVIIPMQHLAQQIELRLQTFRESPQPSHKVMIQTVCHIQTQTVDIEFVYPALDTVQDMTDYILMPQIDLDQIIVAFPALIPQPVIIIGVAAKINIKPAEVRGVLPVLQHILKCPEASAHMIEHTIQHYFDSVLVQVVTHFLEVFIGSQPAIDGVIVPRIISMSIRLKHRRKVYRIDPQLLHMHNPIVHFHDTMLQLPVVLKRRSAKSQRIDLIKNTFISPHSFPCSFLVRFLNSPLCSLV